MGPVIPWESHGNGNKTQNWELEWEGMGNHLSGNGNDLHSHGNLFPKVLCCNELIKLLVYYTCQMPMPIVPSLPTTEMYSAPRAGLCMGGATDFKVGVQNRIRERSELKKICLYPHFCKCGVQASKYQ